MEINASTDGEVNKAKERFRIEMARAAKRSKDLEDPKKLEELANVPPHLLARR